MRRTTRRGFSLIELLIVVAIIAALVGVAVPFFQDNLKDAQQTKAKQDLDTIRNAISLHDAQNRPLTGTSLRPLLGRYLQEIPNDPWGNPYAVDCGVGIVLTFGADGVSGGASTDEDITTRYKSALRIQRAQYRGNWGKPIDAQVVISLSKPYNFLAGTGPATFVGDLQLLRAARDPSPATSDGSPIAFNGGDAPTLDAWVNPVGNWTTQTWGVINDVDNTRKDGIVYVACSTAANVLQASNTQIFTATMAVNFDLVNPTFAIYSTATTPVVTIGVAFGIMERFDPQGPLSPEIYGPYVEKYFTSPEAIELVDGENRGVKLEKL